MIKGIIFDLDDTLYLERDYIKSGFKAVGNELQGTSGYNNIDFFHFLWQLFLNGTRGNTFNLLIEQYPFLKKYVSVNDLISVYRSHKPDIKLLTGAYLAITKLKHKGFKLGVISDGPIVSQQAKVKALNLNELFDTVILTDSWGKEFWKPHPHAFKECASQLKISHYQLCYVADNIQKDFIAPLKLGWKTIQLSYPGQLYKNIKGKGLGDSMPTIVVKDYKELFDIIIAKNKYENR
jgi:putative hydrolase of the HAD superfamily